MMPRNIMVKSVSRLRKLRRMSMQECHCRCKQVARRAIDRRLWRKPLLSRRKPVMPKARVLENATRLVPGAAHQELSALESFMPELHEHIVSHAIEKAEAIISGSWRMLGHEFDLREPIEWHRDPRTAFHWPRHFYADLPLYDLPDEVDVKYVWELGRQQYTVELARACLLTGDQRFGNRARSYILDWIASNPIYEGVHWTSGLEVAMRAIAWIWTLASLAEWDGWRKGDVDRIGISLEEHASYLEHHFSFYSSPYNHLIGEATALLLIAEVLSEVPASARWRRRAVAVLRDHGPRQFYDDGVCVEQATGYHFYTLGFLVQAVLATRSAGCPIEELEDAVRRGFLAGAAFRRPDGRWPAIGDVDSARSIPVHHADFWSFESLCQLAAALFKEPFLKRPSVEPGEELYWLRGIQGIEDWQLLEATAEPPRIHLQTSGYVVAGNERDWFLFDAGPIADGLHPDATSSVAHGHADVFQVLYMRGGEDVLIDPGMSFYGGGRSDWIDYFRSAAAHNTIDIEGIGAVRNAGALAWSHAESPPTLTSDLTEHSWMASGKATWSNGAVDIERHVLVLPGRGMWIADLIRTVRPRQVRWHWHSPKPLAVGSLDELPAICGVSGSPPFSVGAIGSRLEIAALKPTGNSPLARMCAGYGEYSDASMVRVSAFVDREILVVMRVGTVLPFEIRCGGYVFADFAFARLDRSATTAFAHNGVCWSIATEVDIGSDTVILSESDGGATPVGPLSGEGS